MFASGKGWRVATSSNSDSRAAKKKEFEEELIPQRIANIRQSEYKLFGVVIA